MSRMIELIKVKPLSLLMKLFCWILMLLTTVFLILTLTDSWSAVIHQFPVYASPRKMKALGKQVGKFAEFGVEDEKAIYLYTGLGAFAGLLLVTIVGVFFRNAVNSRKTSHHQKKWHLVSAAVFAVLFLAHLYL